MPENYVQANGIRLAYEEFGHREHPAIVLVMGLGTQLLGWPLNLCEGLADRGFRVIRFDNRDVGLSEKMENTHIPRAAGLMLRSRLRLPMDVPYTLEDMARDCVGLMDALNIRRAHLAGASMGGMIGQIVAARFGDRLLSFTSIMSGSGNPRIRTASPRVARRMLLRSLGIEKVNLETTMSFWRLIGSPGYQPSDEALKKRILDSIARSNYREGYSRHMAAIIASGSRVELLKTISTPTLVIHGKDDALVSCQAGIDTAKHIANARLKLFDGMGHDLPEQLVPEFVDLIARHAKASSAPSTQQ